MLGMSIWMVLWAHLQPLRAQGNGKANQATGSLYGTVTDENTGEELIGANVFLRATSKGASVGIDGSYVINGVKPGEYDVQFTYLGYEKLIVTGVNIVAGSPRELNVEMQEKSLKLEEEVVVKGEKPLVDVEESSTRRNISTDQIESAPARQVEEILNTQAGVTLSPSGLRIRGSRTYETGFFIDGVNATDPLAGTGFGLDLGSNAISDIEVNTSSSDVQYGNASGGTVNTQTRSGGEAHSGSLSYKRDHFGFNDDWESTFNQQVAELNAGGPVGLLNKTTGQDTRYFISLRGNVSDLYLPNAPDELNSSVYANNWQSQYWDNRWSGMLKMDHYFSPKMKLMASYIRSITVNQNINMLRITGNDIGFQPGYQFAFQQQPEQANTFTHDNNLQTLRWEHTTGPRFSYRLTLSRQFVKLRSDANGREWRPDTVNTELNSRSVHQFPVEPFNPNDSLVFVEPPSGFVNNGGLASLWHDHTVERYKVRWNGSLYSSDSRNTLRFGTELQRQYLQWIDVTQPWIGAPIQLSDGSYSQSFRLGNYSDVWEAIPHEGAVYVNDRFKYLGLIANAGLRFAYWAPGQFVDNAVGDSLSPIRDEIRQEYMDNTTPIGGLRWKFRLLPKFSASFPIKENQMLYFNYGHSMVQPHPSWVYAGLNPEYQDRSTAARVGNPDLNPEVDISYEVGLKSQITSNDALNFTAFWKDKYDFVTSASVQIADITGRNVNRTIRINSDYARIRGIEASYIKRIGKWFNGQIAATYTIATGQSNSSNEVVEDLLNDGVREDTKEFPLAWNRPVELKGNVLFRTDENGGIFASKVLGNMKYYLEATYRSGQRYTPFIETNRVNIISGGEVRQRILYERDPDPNARFSETGEAQFFLDFTAEKRLQISTQWDVALMLEITNVLNIRNTQIPNPITGEAYEFGDPVPAGQRDPRFDDPRLPSASALPPTNPARYSAPRQIMLGAKVYFN